MASPCPWAKGFPTSNAIQLAIISFFFLIKSAIFLILAERSQAEVFLHISNPFFAECRACSISLLVAFEALPKISSFEGFITS